METARTDKQDQRRERSNSTLVHCEMKEPEAQLLENMYEADSVACHRLQPVCHGITL